MPNQPAPEIELLRAAYSAFNRCGIDAALGLMTPDVAWPEALKGGFVSGADLAGAVLADEYVGPRFTMEQGLIQAMEVCPLPSPGLGT